MRKPVQLALVAMLSLSPLCAKEKNFPKITQMVELTAIDPILLNELVLGLHPDVVIECREGTTLPLKFLQNYELFSVKWVPNLTLHVNQHCYFRCVGKKPYMSQDLITWEKASKLLDVTYKVNVTIDAESGILLETNTTPSTEDDHDEDE
jgi:hypothetical protein